MDRNTLVCIGTRFEEQVIVTLYDSIPGVMVLHDKHLQSKYLGTETQIDIIAVCNKGVFVIEAKNWKRSIKGEETDHHWVGKSLAKDAMRVISPLEQNFVHVRTVRNALRTQMNIEPVLFHSLVCVPDGTLIYSDSSNVCSISQLPQVIERLILSSTDEIDACQYFDAITKII